MKTKNILLGLAVLGSINLSAYTYEVQPLIGQNYTESSAVLDDSNAFGIRLNKYLSEDSAIMFGYTRIIDADYNKKVVTKFGKNARSCGIDPCAPKVDSCKVDPCAPVSNNCDTDTGCTESGYTFDNNDIDGNSGTNSGLDTNNGIGANGDLDANNGADINDNAVANNDIDSKKDVTDLNQPIMPTDKTKDKLNPKTSNLGKSTSSVSTDIDRFYINGLHNIKTNYSRLTPYVYAGFGYERVDNEYNDLKSQGFFDAGLGLKFGINDKVSVLADIQGIKKFRDNDLDVLASVGLGFFFGATNVAPETTVAQELPTPKREVTIVKVQPTVVTVDSTPKSVVGEYYIQLAAAFTTDIEKGCHYTDELQEEGIDYEVKYTTIKGKNASILVTGPYATKDEAKEELYKMKKISKDAFIRTIK